MKNKIIMDKNFLIRYFFEYKSLLNFDENIIKNLINLKKIFLNNSRIGKKILIFGNGGSAAIASHFSVDLTKNAGVRAVNFNEADLITCFSNDFGYENWVSKAIHYYMDEGDIVIFISSSGKSKNMINAVKFARLKKAKKIISFTGFNKNNLLVKKSDINFWVNSKAYNLIENIHQLWLLSLVDLIIGKSIYSAKR
jgi:D-sedoheptulose 7-phosphate isomerase